MERCREARRRTPRHAHTRHAGDLWRLEPPRQAQAPEVKAFRSGCQLRGIETPTASDEKAAGWGTRGVHPDTKGERAKLDDSHEVILAARTRIALGKAYSKLRGPVTGGPNECKDEFRRSGASATILKWLEEGYGFDFTSKVPPISCCTAESDGNHKGCDDPRFRAWLFGVLAEFCVLGVLEETETRNYVTCPLQVIPKADYDEHDPELKHRLRLLLDQRELNAYLNPQKFSNESLHKARGLMRKTDVICTYDICSGFYCAAAKPSHATYMGCTLNGRHFRFRCCPMGVSTSPYVFQALMWVLTRKLRRRGCRLINYCDDFAFFVAPEHADELCDYAEEEFLRHGLTIYRKKCCHYVKDADGNDVRQHVSTACVLRIDVHPAVPGPVRKEGEDMRGDRRDCRRHPGVRPSASAGAHRGPGRRPAHGNACSGGQRGQENDA